MNSPIVTPRVTPGEQIIAGTRRLLLVQLVLTLAAAGMAWFYQGLPATEAALYGGAMAMMNSWIGGRRALAALRMAATVPGQEVMILYIGAVQRFVFTIVFFVIGMMALQLLPPPLLVTFILAQSAYFFGDAQKLKSPVTKTEP